MEAFNVLKFALLFTIIIYFIFEYFDERQIKDEREELIRLKTFELVHKVTTSTLCLLAILYFFVPWMPALYPLLAIVFSFLYTEIIGKLYFRKKF
jgi:hypothetical protein